MLLDNLLKGKTIILASQSPRRQQLLAELGLPFEVRLFGEVDESYPTNLVYTDIPVYLAQKKAEPYKPSLQDNEILITSDTIVWCKGDVLGKPTDRDDAVEILRTLSGCKHTVVTGVAINFQGRFRSFIAETDVYFRSLTDEEILYYIDNFKPFDKAGAYGIQEWIGYVGVERIDGSYFNVMGLPVQKLYSELVSFLQEC
ncbi:MAG: Maf family nucleotide pyrophosphatase [Tenuifilaceae bacterium]|jgi:septum formation protein|nr:Maf family nucleotide pyrophosphatase [Tenuifilaceae bacterium]